MRMCVAILGVVCSQTLPYPRLVREVHGCCYSNHCQFQVLPPEGCLREPVTTLVSALPELSPKDRAFWEKYDKAMENPETVTPREYWGALAAMERRKLDSVLANTVRGANPASLRFWLSRYAAKARWEHPVPHREEGWEL